MGYTNSPLVNYTRLSPNNSGQRKHAIDRISPHCVVGQCSVETLGNIFAPRSRGASCNYGIGADGRVGMYCEEKTRSWCTSSGENDNRAVTIECASDVKEPFAFKPVVYNKLIDLCADICRRNGKKKLIWIADKNKALSYKQKSDEMLLTVHRWFRADKTCPGSWLMARMDDLAAKVNKKLGSKVTVTNTSTSSTSNSSNYVVKVTSDTLNVRQGPGVNYAKTYTLKKGESYTIVTEKGNWGKLKSGLGWINLKYTKRV